MKQYSVLMSVYYKEKPDYLHQSMQSIYRQTVPTDDFVLVCDGPLTPELDEVIAEMQELFGERLHVLRLLKNQGLGRALNAGIKSCRYELVARMDSDDISRPDRCERQLQVFADHPELSLVSGTVEEFTDSIENVYASRRVPAQQAEILAFAKQRNPFNHPCIMYKKSHVEAAGGYQDFFLLEDYYLWIRMLQQGMQGQNIQEPLLWMRGGSAMYKRRGGWKYFLSQRRLLKYMYRTRWINFMQYLFGTVIRLGVSMAPDTIRNVIFSDILRNKDKRTSGGGKPLTLVGHMHLIESVRCYA